MHHGKKPKGDHKKFNNNHRNTSEKPQTNNGTPQKKSLVMPTGSNKLVTTMTPGKIGGPPKIGGSKP